jgi:hypothetical protein
MKTLSKIMYGGGSPLLRRGVGGEEEKKKIKRFIKPSKQLYAEPQSPPHKSGRVLSFIVSTMESRCFCFESFSFVPVKNTECSISTLKNQLKN